MARRSMTAKLGCTDKQIGNPRVVADFLPAPEELAVREDGVRVTLTLSEKSVAFFKREAAKHDAPYQVMIRRLLDAYADRSMQPTRSQSHGRVQEGRPRGKRRLSRS